MKSCGAFTSSFTQRFVCSGLLPDCVFILLIPALQGQQKWAALKDAFRAIDEDKNGLLDRDEIQRAVGILGVNCNQKVIDLVMKVRPTGWW